MTGSYAPAGAAAYYAASPRVNYGGAVTPYFRTPNKGTSLGPRGGVAARAGAGYKGLTIIKDKSGLANGNLLMRILVPCSIFGSDRMDPEFVRIHFE